PREREPDSLIGLAWRRGRRPAAPGAGRSGFRGGRVRRSRASEPSTPGLSTDGAGRLSTGRGFLRDHRREEPVRDTPWAGRGARPVKISPEEAPDEPPLRPLRSATSHHRDGGTPP